MQKKVLLFVAVIVSLALSFTGCSSTGDQLSSVMDTVGSAVAQMLSGDVTGEVGKAYATQWFDFTVESIKFVEEYAGYRAEDGNELVDVLLTETGTFAEPSPMGTFDFSIYSPSRDENYWPISPLDDTMMPDEFDLAKDETVKYHMVYEVPEGLSDLALMYVEVDEEENIGVTFTIKIKR